MTWIVAKDFFSGYIAVFSDIQVTWGTESRDCLKKVYPVAPNMVAGFSGSVDIGFALIHDLAQTIEPHLRAGRIPKCRAIIGKWHRRAKRFFSEQPPSRKKLGCTLIVAGVSPNENNGNTDIPRTDIITMRSQQGFTPLVHKSLDSVSIGSGNDIEACRGFLDSSNNLDNICSLMGSERTFGRAGKQFAFMAGIHLQQSSTPGVSSSVHCTIVSRFGHQQIPIEFTTLIGDDIKIEHKMPRVAESYKEFKSFENNNGSALSENDSNQSSHTTPASAPR